MHSLFRITFVLFLGNEGMYIHILVLEDCKKINKTLAGQNTNIQTLIPTLHTLFTPLLARGMPTEVSSSTRVSKLVAKPTTAQCRCKTKDENGFANSHNVV